MSLDGLRAWIGEVERKLRMRSRVFLVVAAIAVGGAGAGIYLAIDAQDNSVSKADVQAVRDELEARIGAASGETDLTQLEAELKALRTDVTRLKDEGGGGGTSGGTSRGSSEASGGRTGAGDSRKLLESLQKAKEQAGR